MSEVQADLTVSRAYHNDCTLSRLFYGARRSGFGLELPWRGNKPYESCVPEGLYDYEVRHSVKWGRRVIWVMGVPDREYIQWHPGNYTSQIEGCGLPGMGVKYLNADNIPDVISSADTLDDILDHIPEKGKIRYTSALKPVGVYIGG